jgi:hypothetical protein
MAPPFLLGAALFAGGLIVNRRSDRTLRELRRANDGGYVIENGKIVIEQNAGTWRGTTTSAGPTWESSEMPDARYWILDAR